MRNATHPYQRQHRPSALVPDQVEARPSLAIASGTLHAHVTDGPVVRRLPASLPMRFALTRRIRRPACRG